jgi:hypothetical protein
MQKRGLLTHKSFPVLSKSFPFDVFKRKYFLILKKVIVLNEQSTPKDGSRGSCGPHLRALDLSRTFFKYTNIRVSFREFNVSISVEWRNKKETFAPVHLKRSTIIKSHTSNYSEFRFPR